ncbi:hypothetical protein HYALB_00010979 [Hymenoscyphus albidus]|uniref:Hydrophobin n=1 Tax=Hymenoscyphus albidus TaxID=595503 RepID=A0A9N9PWT3_9HELO|nr:hypothetical protein HYALB_00010979 [Hymenoscyphus albidus]
MKLTSVIVLSIATSVMAQLLPKGRFCNDGTEGNGGCEAEGLATYCCAGIDKIGPFQTFRETTVPSRNKANSVSCEPAGSKLIGEIRCAPK